MTEWPVGATTVNAYYDQAGYSIADVSNGFEAGVKYYTFERYLENTCPKVIVDGQEVAMGIHLGSLYKWVAYSIPELENSDHNKAIENEVIVNGVSAAEKNFATDMGFSSIEQAAVLPTSGHGYTRGSGVRYGWSSSIGSTFGDRLENDTYFSLSGEEVYLYLTAAGHTKACTFLDGTTAGDIWTRSWGRADIQTVITYTLIITSYEGDGKTTGYLKAQTGLANFVNDSIQMNITRIFKSKFWLRTILSFYI